MFKKALEAKSLQRLSGADKKKLKRTIKQKFPRASDADIDALLPPKAELTVSKFQNRVHVYGVEGSFPMFFDVDGRGTEIFPTVYALWKVPELLPAFILKGGEVSRFIVGGADLMFPGISVAEEGLPSFSTGEIWAVRVPGNPAPIAVGTTTVSSTEAIKAGLRGKALRITHYYRDSLWESVEGCYVPNAGFLEDSVFGDPSVLETFQASDNCADVMVASNAQENDIGFKGNEESTDAINGHSSSTTGNNCADQMISHVGDLKVTDNVSADGSNTGDQPILSTEDVDVLLDRCFLQALHTTVMDKDLPISGSTLWSNHVLPCRPPGITLDIKKSSHKKLSKWLQSKSSAGLISVKADKYKKEAVLLSVNRSHPDYISFRPEKRQAEKNYQSSEPAGTGSSGQLPKLLEVAEIYKPSVHVNPIFSALGADTQKLYSASDATDIVFRYIENQKLVKSTDRSVVVLDATLCDALFKGTIKKGSTYPTEIHKKDLGHTFINRMQAHHMVTRGSESTIRKGAVKAIQIMTERRQGNKKVTKLWGFETFLLDAEALASELQKKFACSTAVSELPGKKGHEVLVQGGVIDELAKHLTEQYGIAKRYIEVLDKTKK